MRKSLSVDTFSALGKQGKCEKNKAKLQGEMVHVRHLASTEDNVFPCGYYIREYVINNSTSVDMQ